MIYGSLQCMVALMPLMMYIASASSAWQYRNVAGKVITVPLEREHLVRVTGYTLVDGVKANESVLETRVKNMVFKRFQSDGKIWYKMWLHHAGKNQKDRYTDNTNAMRKMKDDEEAAAAAYLKEMHGKEVEKFTHLYLKIQFLAGGLRVNKDIRKCIPKEFREKVYTDFQRQTIYELTLMGRTRCEKVKEKNAGKDMQAYDITYTEVVDAKVGSDQALELAKQRGDKLKIIKKKAEQYFQEAEEETQKMDDDEEDQYYLPVAQIQKWFYNPYAVQKPILALQARIEEEGISEEMASEEESEDEEETHYRIVVTPPIKLVKKELPKKQTVRKFRLKPRKRWSKESRAKSRRKKMTAMESDSACDKQRVVQFNAKASHYLEMREKDYKRRLETEPEQQE